MHTFVFQDHCAMCGAPMAQHTTGYRLDHVPTWIEAEDGWGEGSESCATCGEPRFMDS